jgi:hypothetical protein
MSGRDERLAPLLQSWQHFLMILATAYLLSCIAVSILAKSMSHELFVMLPNGHFLSRLLFWGAVSAWESFAVGATLCFVFYLLGRAYRLQLALFLLGLARLLAHFALMGLAARNLLPPQRKQLLVGLLVSIGCDDSPAVRQWKADSRCTDVVGCSAAAVRFLNLRSAGAFWATAGFLALIVGAFAGIGIVTLLMARLRREADERFEMEAEESLTPMDL